MTSDLLWLLRRPVVFAFPRHGEVRFLTFKVRRAVDPALNDHWVVVVLVIILVAQERSQI